MSLATFVTITNRNGVVSAKAHWVAISKPTMQTRNARIGRAKIHDKSLIFVATIGTLLRGSVWLRGVFGGVKVRIVAFVRRSKIRLSRG